MIKLGERWIVDERWVVHLCGPDLRARVTEDRSHCDCGADVPRRVQLFRAWLVIGRRAFHVFERP